MVRRYRTRNLGIAPVTYGSMHLPTTKQQEHLRTSISVLAERGFLTGKIMGEACSQEAKEPWRS
jgi:hypothetical protein